MDPEKDILDVIVDTTGFYTDVSSILMTYIYPTIIHAEIHTYYDQIYIDGNNYMGLTLKTNDDEDIYILISNGLSCCEKWGMHINDNDIDEVSELTLQTIKNQFLYTSLLNVKWDIKTEQKMKYLKNGYGGIACIKITTLEKVFNIVWTLVVLS